MKKSLILLAGLLIPALGPVSSLANEGGAMHPNDDISIDWSDKVSMQRGAKLFTNYCMGCHSLKYSR